MVFLVVIYECESWTMKKAEHRRADAFKLCGWRRLLRVPWTARRLKQSILKEIKPEYSLEGLMLPEATWGEKSTHWKRTWCWERLRVGGEGGNRGWDGWMASWIQWTWAWASSGRLWRTEAWCAAVHGVTKSRTWLSYWTTSNKVKISKENYKDLFGLLICLLQ